MASEMPKSEDLIKNRENLQQRVAAIQAQKNQDIEARVLGLGKNGQEIKKLEEILEEATSNLKYYEELDKSGQLPEDETENFEKAKQLVIDIKAKTAEGYEIAKKTMAIPEVQGKAEEEAGKLNATYNEEERWKQKEKDRAQKEKIMEEKFYQWLKKIYKLAEELNKEQDEARAEYEQARDNLREKIDSAEVDGKLKENLKDTLKYLYVNLDNFKELAVRHKSQLGKLSIFKKAAVDSIINLSELQLLEQAKEKFIKFLDDNKLKGYEGRGLGGCAIAILNANNYGVMEELRELSDLAYAEPYVNSHTMIDRACKKDKQKFEKAGLEPKNILMFYGIYSDNLKRMKEEEK